MHFYSFIFHLICHENLSSHKSGAECKTCVTHFTADERSALSQGSYHMSWPSTERTWGKDHLKNTEHTEQYFAVLF